MSTEAEEHQRKRSAKLMAEARERIHRRWVQANEEGEEVVGGPPASQPYQRGH
jgi:hypothetical protein